MQILKLREIKKRQLVKNYENSKYVFKLIESNLNIKLLIQYNLILIKNLNVPKNSCVTRLRQRCLLTHNKTTLNKYFKLSRHMFLKYARFNFFFGLKKFYW
jgi:ribosomal protein S14